MIFNRRLSHALKRQLTSSRTSSRSDPIWCCSLLSTINHHHHHSLQQAVLPLSLASYSTMNNQTMPTTTATTPTTATATPNSNNNTKNKSKTQQKSNANHTSSSSSTPPQRREPNALVNKHLTTLLYRSNGISNHHQYNNNKKNTNNNNNNNNNSMNQTEPFQQAIQYATQNMKHLNNHSFTLLYEMASKNNGGSGHNNNHSNSSSNKSHAYHLNSQNPRLLSNVKQVDELLLNQVIAPLIQSSPIVFSSRMNAYVKIGHAPMALSLFHELCVDADDDDSPSTTTNTTDTTTATTTTTTTTTTTPGGDDNNNNSSGSSTTTTTTTTTTTNNNNKKVIVPDTLIYNLLLLCHMHMNQTDQVFRTFDVMNRMGVRPNVRTLTMMMEYLVKSGRVERALVMFDEFAKSEIDYVADITTSSTLQHQNPQHQKKNHNSSTTNSSNSTNSSSNSNSTNNSIHIINGDNRESIDTRSMVFNVLLKSLLQQASLSYKQQQYNYSAVATTAENQQQQQQNYGYKKRNLSGADGGEGIIFVNGTSFNQVNMKMVSTIFYSIRDVHLQNVRSSLDRDQNNSSSSSRSSSGSGSQSQQNQLQNNIMDTVSYNTMLKAFYDHGQFYEAKKLICCLAEDAQIDTGLTLTLHTYNTIIDSLVQTGRLDEAMEILELMKVQPNAYTFASLINGCAKQQDLSRAHTVFARAVQSGIIPDHNLCTSMMKVFGVCGQTDDAVRFVETMRRMGINPSAWAYVGLFKAFRREMKFEEAWQYLLNDIPQNSFDINIHFVSGMSHLVRNRKHMDYLMPMYRSVRDKCLKPILQSPSRFNNTNNINNNSSNNNVTSVIDFAIEDSTGLKVETFYKRILREALFLNLPEISLELLCDLCRSTGMSQADVASMFNYFLELQVVNPNDASVAPSIKPHKIVVINQMLELTQKGEARMPKHASLLSFVRHFASQLLPEERAQLQLDSLTSWIKQRS